MQIVANQMLCAVKFRNEMFNLFTTMLIRDLKLFCQNIKTIQMEERNCAFQYAKMRDGIFRDTTIVEDKTGLTLAEAKELWNAHFKDAAKWIKDGNTVEMVIWNDMDSPQSYGKWLEYISTNAESDGNDIWETKKTYFTKQFKQLEAVS